MTDYTSILDGVTETDLAATGGEPGHTPYDVPYIQIEDDGDVGFGIRTVYGPPEGVPARIWHGVDRRYDMSGNPDLDTLRADLADGGRMAALIDRIKAGHTVKWNGSNYVGHLSVDASDAAEDLARLVENYPQSDQTAWDCTEWLWAGKSSARTVLDEIGLTHESADWRINEVADELADTARQDRVVLTGGETVGDVIRALIAEARQDMADAEALADE